MFPLIWTVGRGQVFENTVCLLLLLTSLLQLQEIWSDQFHGLPVVRDTQLTLISELMQSNMGLFSPGAFILIFKIKLSVVLQSVIPAFERWRKKDQPFQVILGYIVT